MKKITIVFILIHVIVCITYSQIKLLYDVHGLKSGINNNMSYCSYLEPGIGGSNVTWDFSKLNFDKSFTGFLNNPTFSKNSSSFPYANVELAEFDARFYLNVQKDLIEEYGYSSSNGKAKFIYTQPSVKMKYPFSYGDYFTGVFTGYSEFNNVKNGEISGDYSVEADAFGTLILPDNISYENVLRVKSFKQYNLTDNNSTQFVTVTTYRWYNSVHRYPLLVLIEQKTTIGEKEYIGHQAAYNSVALKQAIELQADPNISIAFYPNPTSSELTLQISRCSKGTLLMEIYDISGKLKKSIIRTILSDGFCQFDLSGDISSLLPGKYLIKIWNADIYTTKDITILE